MTPKSELRFVLTKNTILVFKFFSSAFGVYFARFFTFFLDCDCRETGMKRFSPQDVPAKPGVYVFRNSQGEIIYVGKAKSLRHRLSSYFQPSRKLRAETKVRALIKSIAKYEVFPVKTEAEALLLESRFIKAYSPRYNVVLRDDKRYLHLSLDLAEPFPRLRLTRIRKEDGRLYFGPFPHARALRDTVEYLSRHFGIRTCKPHRPDSSTFKHCLEDVFKACSCPCVGKISEEDYRHRVEQVVRVLQGNTKEILEELTAKMHASAEARQFEDAAQTRDIIENLRFVCSPGRRTFMRTTVDTKRDSAANVQKLQKALGMRSPPTVIECFDMSNIGGQLAVGSLVCFRNGKASRKDYRRYKIRLPEATDDTAMMREVVYRRYLRMVKEGRALPDLIVLDGGKGQLRAAIEALENSTAPPIPMIALAKKKEEIFISGQSAPLRLPRHHDGLKLLQALRDEAHRFAISYHRTLRNRRIADSLLGEVEGVGKARQRLLLQHFGSVKEIRKATPNKIAATVPGLGIVLATRLSDFLQQHAGS